MKTEEEQVDAIITKYSRKQLKDLGNKIDMLLYTLSLEPDYDKDLRLFYDAIITHLAKEDLSYPPLSSLKSRQVAKYNKLRYLYENYLAWLKKLVPDLNDSHHLTAYNLFAKVMIYQLKQMNFNISLNSLLNISNEFQSYFNMYFPDYLIIGLRSQFFGLEETLKIVSDYQDKN